MSKTIEVKIVEVEANKLDPNAKYIITLSPQYVNWIKNIAAELKELIGNNFLIIPVNSDDLKVHEILPKDES
jgi:hypothetical protein